RGAERYVVALVLEDRLPEVRGRLALGPAREHADRDGLRVVRRALAAVTRAAGAGRQAERRRSGDRDGCEKSLLHIFLSAPAVQGDWGLCAPGRGRATPSRSAKR